MFVSVRMATLTATGFPQLFWNEGNASASQRVQLIVAEAKNRQAEARNIVIAAITPSAKKMSSLFLSAGRDGSDNIRMSKSSFWTLHMVARNGLTDSQHKSRAPAALRR